LQLHTLQIDTVVRQHITSLALWLFLGSMCLCLVPCFFGFQKGGEWAYGELCRRGWVGNGSPRWGPVPCAQLEVEPNSRAGLWGCVWVQRKQRIELTPWWMAFFCGTTEECYSGWIEYSWYRCWITSVSY